MGVVKTTALERTVASLISGQTGGGMNIFFHLLTLTALAVGEPVLRYNLSSCNSLEPVYVEENWQTPGMDAAKDEDMSSSIFENPRKSRKRNPPFELRINFDQYRRNRQYKVYIITTIPSESFDSFLLQARGAERSDGNASLVGTFISPLPSISKPLSCLEQPSSSLTDKGRPVQLQNLTFTWLSPPSDHGQVRFTLSLVHNGEYIIIESRQIRFNTFPVSIRGCGREVTCFRQCNKEAGPTCPADLANYFALISFNADAETLTVSMGGRIMDYYNDDTIMSNNSHYIAMGIGNDKKNFKMMDVTACHLKDNSSVMLEHYYLEDKTSQLYPHKAPVTSLTWDIDTATGLIWCNFSRSVYPKTMWELDLGLHLYQFYFIGIKNESGVFLPDLDNVWESNIKSNFSKVTNTIEYSATYHGRTKKLKNFANCLNPRGVIFALLLSILYF